MAAEISSFDRNREILCLRIVDVLRSWPELQRRVFMLSHYRGDSAEDISSMLGLRTGEVKLILEHCDRKLRNALKTFRDGSLEAESPSMTADSLTSNGCCV